MRARSCCKAERCSEDNRFSLRTALASSAERAHAGRCLAVMQAFGQRAGWQSAVSGVLWSALVACFRHRAVPGSKSRAAGPDQACANDASPQRKMAPGEREHSDPKGHAGPSAATRPVQ